jgi:hypothetical protein
MVWVWEGFVLHIFTWLTFCNCELLPFLRRHFLGVHSFSFHQYQWYLTLWCNCCILGLVKSQNSTVQQAPSAFLQILTYSQCMVIFRSNLTLCVTEVLLNNWRITLISLRPKWHAIARLLKIGIHFDCILKQTWLLCHNMFVWNYNFMMNATTKESTMIMGPEPTIFELGKAKLFLWTVPDKQRKKFSLLIICYHTQTVYTFRYFQTSWFGFSPH